MVGEYLMADTTEILAPLTPEELRKIDAYWRACNYLSAGMIYLRANPLLRQPLKPQHFKNRLLGHWGSDPGQSLIWVHLNRLIKKYDLNVMYIAGPGMARRRRWPTAISKATTLRFIQTRARTRLGCLSSSNSSRFLEELARTARRRRRVPFMKAGSSGIPFRMLTGQRSIIPT